MGAARWREGWAALATDRLALHPKRLRHSRGALAPGVRAQIEPRSSSLRRHDLRWESWRHRSRAHPDGTLFPPRGPRSLGRPALQAVRDLRAGCEEQVDVDALRALAPPRARPLRRHRDRGTRAPSSASPAPRTTSDVAHRLRPRASGAGARDPLTADQRIPCAAGRGGATTRGSASRPRRPGASGSAGLSARGDERAPRRSRARRRDALRRTAAEPDADHAGRRSDAPGRREAEGPRPARCRGRAHSRGDARRRHAPIRCPSRPSSSAGRRDRRRSSPARFGATPPRFKSSSPRSCSSRARSAASAKAARTGSGRARRDVAFVPA